MTDKVWTTEKLASYGLTYPWDPQDAVPHLVELERLRQELDEMGARLGPERAEYASLRSQVQTLTTYSTVATEELAKRDATIGELQLNLGSATSRWHHYEQRLKGADATIVEQTRSIEELQRLVAQYTDEAKDEFAYEGLERRIAVLDEALWLYADPGTYFAVAFLSDPPCGEFMDDFDSANKPGRRARVALGICPQCLAPMTEHSPPTVDDAGCPHNISFGQGEE